MEVTHARLIKHLYLSINDTRSEVQKTFYKHRLDHMGYVPGVCMLLFVYLSICLCCYLLFYFSTRTRVPSMYSKVNTYYVTYIYIYNIVVGDLIQ